MLFLNFLNQHTTQYQNATTKELSILLGQHKYVLELFYFSLLSMASDLI